MAFTMTMREMVELPRSRWWHFGLPRDFMDTSDTSHPRSKLTRRIHRNI